MYCNTVHLHILYKIELNSYEALNSGQQIFFPNVAFLNSRHQSGMWLVTSEAVYVRWHVGRKARPIQMKSQNQE